MNTFSHGLLLAAAAGSLLAACTMVSVKTDADPQTDFAKYRTYAVSQSPASGSRVLPPSSFATLQSNLESGLAAKGFQKSSNPSFVIVYHLAARPRSEVFISSNWGGFGPGFKGYWPGYYTSLPIVTQFTEGMLVLDFVDATAKRLIWRGAAVGIVGSRTAIQRSIEEAVRKMLENFPPQR